VLGFPCVAVRPTAIRMLSSNRDDVESLKIANRDNEYGTATVLPTQRCMSYRLVWTLIF
jgi:hypothetical protein